MAVCWGLCLCGARAEEPTRRVRLTLREAIQIAQVNSVDAAVALNELRTAYWEYRTHRADQLPEVMFTGTLPSYSKQYAKYQQSDGSYTYVRNNYLGLNGEISITQNIALTGGQIALNTSLDFTRQLGHGAYNEIMSVPVGLTLTQPIFGVNDQKWKRRIEPVRYEEAKAAFMESVENVTISTITHYFNLLLAKDSREVCEQNLANANKLYDIAVAKRKIGYISESELMRLEQSALQAKAKLTDARSNYNAMMFQLRSFLGMSERDEIEPVLPGTVEGVRMDYQAVLEKALENNSFAKNILRRQLEADYDVPAGGLQSVARQSDRGGGFLDSYPGLGQAERTGEGGRVESRGGTFPDPAGADGVQSECLPLGGEFQQPSRPTGDRRGGGYIGGEALPDLYRDLYGGENRHPRPERRAKLEGRCPAEAYRGVVLLLALFLQHP